MILRRPILSIGCALIAAVNFAAVPASAEGLLYDVKVGALYHDMPWLWSNFQLEKTSVDINLDAQFTPSLRLFSGTLRPAVGASLSTAGQTSTAYIDARWTYEWPSNYFFATGLGVAIHDGKLGLVDYKHKALGYRELFHIPIEIGYHLDTHTSVSLYFEHMSNAYTQPNNEGLDRLGVRYGYRF